MNTPEQKPGALPRKERVENRERQADSDPATWIDQFGDAMFRYVMKKTGDANVAEELVQETMLAGLRSRKDFRGESTVSTWLFGILRRKVVDYFRRKKTESLDYPKEDSQPAEPTSSWMDNPAEIFEDREFWRVFEGCVEKLPNKFAEVYMLREINRNSPQEICKILGISATNLSMRLHRCRLALKDCLQQNWFRDKDYC
ncbi:MAG: sigma-70 family RNA polymerase sigma factor [Planctomycetota bacterium]